MHYRRKRKREIMQSKLTADSKVYHLQHLRRMLQFQQVLLFLSWLVPSANSFRTLYQKPPPTMTMTRSFFLLRISTKMRMIHIDILAILMIVKVRQKTILPPTRTMTGSFFLLRSSAKMRMIRIYIKVMLLFLSWLLGANSFRTYYQKSHFGRSA